MIRRIWPLLIVSLVMEICGCIILYKFAGWQVAVGVQLVVWGRQITLAQVAKQKRESMPPSMWAFLD